jgi:uncharacterized protein (TIGR03435 family)
MKRFGFAAALLAAWLCPAVAQPEIAPKFDAASVKTQAGEWVFNFKTTPDSVIWQGADMGRLIRFAYDLQHPFQVAGPGWINAGKDGIHYDINAKAAHAGGDAQLRLMMRSLLAERWNLSIHRESREVRTLVLTAGKGPLRLNKSATDGPGSMASNEQGIARVGGTMAELARDISDWLPDLVVNETGLDGRYDYKIDFLKYTDYKVGARFEEQDFETGFAIALQKVGLSLKAARRNAEIIAIDHVERVPTEN